MPQQRSRREAVAEPAPKRAVVEHAVGRFGDVYVVEERHRRCLRFDSPRGTDQSILDLRDPARLVSAYLHAVVLGAVLAEPLERALLVGLGGGGFVRFARRHLPGLRVDAVEVDPTVVRLARRHFAARPGAKLAIHVADAAAHVAASVRAGRTYDLVVLDAYGGSGIPADLASRSFFEDVRRIVAPRGIAIANVGLADRHDEDRLLARFASVFRARCFELRNDHDDNRVAVAARTALPSGRSLLALARRLDDEGRFPFLLERIARTRRACPRPRDGRRPGSGPDPSKRA